MRFDVITLFPELFAPFLAAGVTRRAFETRQVDVRLWNLRDFAEGNYRRVDDRPFGGGPGMVMLAGAAGPLPGGRSGGAPDAAPGAAVLPDRRRIDHRRWSAGRPAAGAILLCGRYEGIDQRFIDAHVDVQLSLGDFVLSGGEIAAMALLDAVARLQPGVLNDAGSHQEDSFNPRAGRPAGLPALHAGRRNGTDAGCPRNCCRPPCPHRRLAPTAKPGAHGQASARPDCAARQDGRLTRAGRGFLAGL
jgi:tRNA (guanine37-N1)-methyltransferase